ncbi:MAG: hypothetical protein R3F62_21955 [Planctomycetota bacterium]
MRRTAAWGCVCLLLVGTAVAQDDAAPAEGEGTTEGQAEGEGEGEVEDLTETAPANENPQPTLPVQRNELNRNQLGEDLSLPPAGSSLGEGIRLRPWLVFQPSYRLAAFYDTNIFRQSWGNRDDDVEITNTLTGRLAATRERWDAAISYSAIIRNYLDNSSLSTVDHLVQTSAGLRFNRVRFTLNGSAGLSSRPTDPQFNGGLQRRFTAQGNFATIVTITQRIGARLEAQVQRIDFKSRQFDFFDQLGYGGAAFATYTPLGLPVSFLAGAGYRWLRYTDSAAVSPDIALASGQGGISVFTADQRLTFDLRAGYEVGRIVKRRNFPADRDAPEGIFVSAAGGWQPTQVTSITLTFTRQITFSAQADTLILTRADLSVTQGLPANTSVFFRVGYGVQDNRQAPGRRTHDVTLGATWDPLPWLSVGTQASYLGSQSRVLDYGVFRVGASITLRL